MTASRPPGPRDGLFGVHTLRRIKADVLGFYTALHRDHGDAAYIRFGPFHDFTFFHPDQVREVLVEKAKHFSRMWRQVQVLRQWNGDGLILADGDAWLRYRRLVQPAFHHGRFPRYAAEVVAAAETRFAAWGAAPGVVGFEQAMTDLTMDVITRTMFGSVLPRERDDLARALKVLNGVAMREMTTLFTLPDWLPLPGKAEKRWAIRTLDGTVRRLIAERRKAGTDRGDLLSMLLLAADEEGGGRLTDEQARDQCVGIFLAGHDTAAAGMTWVGWALAAHPEVAGRTAAEVGAALGDRDPTFADLPRLKYVERVVKEALRHRPPAFGVFTRQAVREVEIGGWAVPRGASVHLFPFVTHHDPRWFPDPEKFDPDRFAPGRAEQIPQYAYFPFGGGPRVCIGNNFAMAEMTLLTAMLVRRFALAPAPGQGEPVPVAGMSLRPAGGLRLVLTPR
jgi:cytochrome P450